MNCLFGSSQVQFVVWGSFMLTRKSPGDSIPDLKKYECVNTKDPQYLHLSVVHYVLLAPLCYSDSTRLMADSFPVLKQLKNLLHLSLSRCYHIHLAALT